MSRIHRRTIQKDLSDSYNHNGVITHLESDTLECEVKRALGSTTTNKVSGGDEISVELFQILKDDAKVMLKCCTQYASKFGKFSSGQRTGKGQLSFQAQRKSMPKNVQPITQLHSSHILASNALNSSSQASIIRELRTSRCLSWIKRHMSQRSSCQHLLDHQKSKRVPEKHLLLFYWLYQSLSLCGSQQSVENS